MKNTHDVVKNIYEIEKMLIKKSIKIKRSRISKIQYRVKWLNWEDQHNQWINVAEMNNAKNLINDFEAKLVEKSFTSQ
jgi:hypothetical protein